MFKRLPLAPLLLAFSALPSASAFATALHTERVAPLNPVLGPEALCLPALALAILTEGIVVLVGARILKKPAGRLLKACVFVNLITVTALSLATGTGLIGSVMALVVAEIAIWLFEGFFLWRYARTLLNWKEAFSLSFAMNLASFAAGYGVVALLFA